MLSVMKTGLKLLGGDTEVLMFLFCWRNNFRHLTRLSKIIFLQVPKGKIVQMKKKRGEVAKDHHRRHCLRAITCQITQKK